MTTNYGNVVRLADRRTDKVPLSTIARALALHDTLADEFASLLLGSDALRDVARDDIVRLATRLADVALPIRD